MTTKTTTGARRAFFLGVLRLHHPAAIPPHAVMPRPCYMAGPGEEDDDPLAGDDIPDVIEIAGPGRPLSAALTMARLENELRGRTK